MNNATHPETFDFEMLYRDLFTPVFRYVLFRTKDYDLACDITQSTFLKYMRQNNGPKDMSHAKNILFIIAKNLLIDNWRSKKNNNVPIDEIGEIGSGDINQEEALIRKEDFEYLHLVMKDLSEIENEIVSMRTTLELDYKVIASELNITEANARQIYSRALRKVGETLKNSGRF